MDDKLTNKYLEKFDELGRNYEDEEDWHRDVDKLLCELLNELGYFKIVKSYEYVKKCYV